MWYPIPTAYHPGMTRILGLHHLIGHSVSDFFFFYLHALFRAHPFPCSTTGGHDQPAVKGGAPSRSHPGNVDLLVFNILNTFRRHWFLFRTNLLANTISAQKAEDGKISWVEFTPPFHSHLVKCAVALVPHPVHVVKRVMFVFILELLNGAGASAFFELQKGGHKANNAQKEKRCLARKRR
ncbi:hypothetical protein BJY52DRAFT_1227942 [Lactarius psammicola]|nr:hypothetical protein BJY52DRAFT_1227942 [Lactarius psammicola]